MIDALINKLDNFEVVRRQIALILLTETAQQQVLAAAADEDPDDWKFDVYEERFNPWEKWRDRECGSDPSPIVNVSFDNSRFDGSSSNIVERQRCSGAFNIDCYGFGVSENVEGGGHTIGDMAAAEACQRAVRFVRNVLMSNIYTYLALDSGPSTRFVGKRWIDSINQYQPEFNMTPAEKIVAARIVFRVDFNEFSPQNAPETLELVTNSFTRAEDGQLILEAGYDYT